MVSLWICLLLRALPVFARDVGEPRRGLKDRSVINRRISDTPGVDSYRARAFHSVAVLDRYLYIVGGELSQFVDGKDDEDESRAVSSTLSIPLDKSWDPSTVSIKTSESGDLPLKNFAILWVDDTNKRLYSFGGEDPHQNDVITANFLWGFEPDGEGGGEWSNQYPSYEAITWMAKAGYATCGNTGVSLGGVNSWFTDEDASSEDGEGKGVLQEYTMEGNLLSWYTTHAFNHPYGIYVGGRAVCGTAVNSDPLFFPIGGESYEEDADRATEMAQMKNLTFYNPKDKTWHWQEPGNAPPPRASFCAVGVESPDGTYEIFIYGGQDSYGGNTKSMSDIHVLSIPAFQWFEVKEKSTRRTYHDCASAGNSQMIVVGGMDLAKEGRSSNRWETTDEWKQGLGIFDMHDLKWKDSYDPEAGAYESPDMVREWYADGGFDKIEWSGDDVKNMFAGFKLPSKAPNDEKNKKPIGAIVGGSIGGLAGILALSALASWFLRRRKRSAHPLDTAADTPAMKGPEKNAMELDASGYRDPPPPQELDAQRDLKASRRQELDASAYREEYVSQELDGGWAAAQATMGGHYAQEHGSNAGSISELHAGVSGVDSSRKNGTMSPELPG